MGRTIMEQQNEVVEIKSVITDRYRARQADSFKSVGTTAGEWQPCPILEIKEKVPGGPQVIVYDIPAGYREVTPYFDSLTKNDMFLLMRMVESAAISGQGWKTYCQLCGHGIKEPRPIQHDGRKLLMFVGSECVNNFMGAGYVFHQIKIFKETKLRQQFRDWIPIALEECKKHPVKDYYGRLNTGWIEEPFYDLRKKIFKVKNEREDKINTLSSMKIKNIFKEARALNIPIPEGVNLDTKKKKVAQAQ